MHRTIALLLLPFLLSAGQALAQGARGQGGTAQGGAAQGGAAQGPLREVTVSNRARQPVQELYASPSSTDDWGDNRLGSEALAPGKTFRLRLGRTRECNWDLQVIYADGSTEENRDLNLCRRQLVAFDGSGAVSGEPGPPRSLAVQNAAPEAIDQLYVSPADSDRWLDNRLAEPIRPGANGTADYRGPCLVDLRVVYANRAAEERRGVDTCQLERLVVAPGWVLGADPSAAPAGDGPMPAGRVAVRNEGSRTIVELYVYPDGGERGSDRLGMSVLDPGQERRIPVLTDKGCAQTLHAVLSGTGPDLERTGIDVCRERNLTVTSDGIQSGRPGPVQAGTAPR